MPQPNRLVLSVISSVLLAIDVMPTKAGVSDIASNTPTYIAAALPTAEQLAERRYRNSIALHTQLSCSGVFVSGRNAQAVIDEDLQKSIIFTAGTTRSGVT